MASAEN